MSSSSTGSATPTPPNRNSVMARLKFGLAINMFGFLFTLIGLQSTVGLLVAKTLVSYVCEASGSFRRRNTLPQKSIALFQNYSNYHNLSMISQKQTTVAANPFLAGASPSFNPVMALDVFLVQVILYKKKFDLLIFS